MTVGIWSSSRKLEATGTWGAVLGFPRRSGFIPETVAGDYDAARPGRLTFTVEGSDVIEDRAQLRAAFGGIVQCEDRSVTAEQLEILHTASATQAARVLGLSIRSVYRERQRLGIQARKETRSSIICGTPFVALQHRRHLTCGPKCAAQREASQDQLRQLRPDRYRTR
jgi:hypothetical protein